jgi:signal transduction histidine kinase
MTLFHKLVATLPALVFAVAVQAAERGTPDEAKALLVKAVTYLKANGKDKAFAQFADKQGAFVNHDLYVTVIDLQGKTLVHPFSPQLVGKTNLELEDADGKLFYKERLEVAKAKGSGQQDYKVIHPKTKALEVKRAFFEKVDDVVLTTGAFKP